MDFYLRTRLSLFVRAVYKEDINSEIKTIQNGVFHETKWRIPRNKMAYSTTQNGVFHTQLREVTFKLSYGS